MEERKTELSKNVFEEFEKNIKEKVKIIYTELMREINQHPDISNEVEDEYEQKVKQKIKSSFKKLIADVGKSFQLFSKLIDEDKDTPPLVKQDTFYTRKKESESKHNEYQSKARPIILVEHDEYGQTVYSTPDDLKGIVSPIKSFLKAKDKLNDGTSDSIVIPSTLKAVPISTNDRKAKTNKALPIKEPDEDDNVDNICDECGYLGASKEQLKRHLKYAHASSGNEWPADDGNEIFRCTHCEFKGENKYTVTSHIKHVHGSKDYKCRICSYATSIKYNLVLHIKNTHTSSDPNNSFKCLKCDYTAATSRILNKHNTRIHVKQGIENQEFDNKAEMVVNPKKVGGELLEGKESIKRLYNGENVDAIYPDFDVMQKRENQPLVASDLSRIVPASKRSTPSPKARPTGLKSNNLAKESEIANQKSQLKNKIKLKSEDGFSEEETAPLLAIKTEAEDDLETEGDALALNDLPSHTDLPKSENDSAKPIKRRRRRRRKLDPSQKAPRKEKLVYDCDLCDQTGFLRRDFRMHIALAHTDPEKLLHCTQCDYVADAQYNMNSHMKGVHGEKVFQCNDCAYSTSKKFNLVLHSRNQHTIKSPEDQYRCNQCEYSSPDIKYLKKHYTVTHEKS